MSRQKMGIGALIVMLSIPLVLFQNCGGIGHPANLLKNETSSSSSAPTDNFIAASAVPSVPFATYSSCYTANSASSTALAACLNAGATNTSSPVFTSTTIDTCVAAGNTTAISLAFCLTKNSEVVANYRSPKQFDFEYCAANPSAKGMLYCLAARGVLQTLTQAQIDACSNTAGSTGIEACLLKAGEIPKGAGIIMQADADLCTKVEGGTTTLALCLQNSGLIPATITQAAVDACVTAATASGVVGCLRKNYALPRVLMQFHINACNAAAGQAGIATCLDKQGVFPAQSTNNGVAIPTPAASITALQSGIDACITNVGLANTAQCLRKHAAISDQVMQPHIASCYALLGVDAYKCLVANFPVLPVTLTDAALKACFAASTTGAPGGAANCLAKKGILNTAPAHANIYECINVAGEAPDTSATRPGQVGVATCLNNSGMLPAALTQAEIDTCFATGNDISVCLDTKGFVPSLAQMTAATGVFGAKCMSCHSANAPNGNLNFADVSTVIAHTVPGSPTTSQLYTDITGGIMPPNGSPKPTPAEQAAIALWITQGSNNN